MPGIFGIISRNPDDKHKEDLYRMQDVLLKAGDFSSDIYCNEEMGVYAGWYVPRGSFSDCLPITNEKKDIWLLYFGENFTDISVFNYLKSKNHRFDRNNASYLVHLYEDNEDEFLKQLNGLFVGLIIDKRKQKCILFNDRYGMQRLYYHQSNNAFYFSSESKAILKVKKELCKFALNGLAEHLVYRCVSGHKSLFPEIYTLPGGASWQFKNSDLKKNLYFSSAEWENQTLLENDFFYSYLKNTITKIFPNYLRSDNPIGVKLSNGLDTSMLISKIRLAADKYPCFSYNYTGHNTSCADKNQKVAVALSQPYYDISLDTDYLENFPDYAQQTIFISDGNLLITDSHELYFVQKTHQIAPIQLTGDYGNVLFRPLQTPEFKIPDTIFLAPGFDDYFTAAQAAHQGISDTHPITQALFVCSPWHEYNRLALQQSQITVRSIFHDNDLASVMYRNYYDANQHYQLGRRLVSEAINPILADTNSNQAATTTAGFSFLIYKYLNALPIKARDLWQASHHRWDTFFSRFQFGNLSSGLEHHRLCHQLYKNWYRNELSGYIQSVLLDDRTLSRTIFSRKGLESMVVSHIKGQMDFTNEITWAVTIELIYQQLLKNL